VVTHARGKVRAYELWNEADYSAFWSASVEQLVRMSVDAAAIIHSIDPSALVLSPSITNNSQGYAFLQRYLSLLPPGSIDAIAVHGYTNDAWPENALPALIGRVRSALPPAYANTPIWSTEGSWGLNSRFSSAASDQRAFVARYELQMLAQGVGRAYWYAYQNSQWGTLWDGSALTPAGIAMRTVEDWLAGATLDGCETDGNLWTCNLTTSAGRNARIVWTEKAPVQDYPTAGYSTMKTLDGGSSRTRGSLITVASEPVLLSSFLHAVTGVLGSIPPLTEGGELVP
jgi:Glycosyl hydrolase catalytic core